MKLTSGYHFFQDGEKLPGCGFVLLKIFKSMVKIQCVLDNLPSQYGTSVLLCLSHSSGALSPYTIGKMYLTERGKMLKGQGNFIVRDLTGSFWNKYNCFTVQNTRGKIILQTLVDPGDYQQKKQREPFDPFKTTNSAYSWDRAETVEEFQHKLEINKVSISPEIFTEVRDSLIKYRHVLLGKYTTGSRIYFIIGTPGVRPPADENAVFRWINKVISLEEYPYFDGYKLYYIDKETSALVKAVLRTQPASQ